MKLVLLLSLFLSNAYAETKCVKHPIQIGVIDTGFGMGNKTYDAKLCKYGHKDFSTDKSLKDGVPRDLMGHGTNIVGTIQDYANRSGTDFCFIIIKFYSQKQTDQENAAASIEAIKYALQLKVDIVNYSGGGPTILPEEEKAVKKFLNAGHKFIAAAGNDGKELGHRWYQHQYYPAMYDKRIIVVGNLGPDGNKSWSSNYGPLVNRWEVGEDVEEYGLIRSGTSQATAIATGKIVAASNNSCTLGSK